MHLAIAMPLHLSAHLWPHHAERFAYTTECVMPPAINLYHAHKLELASLVHGSSQQELESLLDFGRLGVEKGGEGLEFGGEVGGCGFHDQEAVAGLGGLSRKVVEYQQSQ